MPTRARCYEQCELCAKWGPVIHMKSTWIGDIKPNSFTVCRQCIYRLKREIEADDFER